MMIEPVFHQLKLAIDSLIMLCDILTEEDLEYFSEEQSRTIREQLVHLSLICLADLYIAQEASQQEMDAFYASDYIQTLTEIKESLRSTYSALYCEYASYTPEQLMEQKTSYWGVTYSRFGWLIEIFGHFYHHRGQVQAQLSAKGIAMQGITWFE
ncbi:MAG: DinB family protein [Gorillibacterium sp.]|nr:DinB family protein [Gorillibacterium sp.]